MKTFLNTSIALGMFLSSAVMTYPAASESAPAMDRPHPHHKVNSADAKALAPFWATPAAGATSPAHETDGLSRNPDDCNFGCIDNN
ncbi:MAG TPA: hypothetical protein VGG86_06600 [Roseiarcus sp.]|jgi:hypothetical protein